MEINGVMINAIFNMLSIALLEFSSRLNSTKETAKRNIDSAITILFLRISRKMYSISLGIYWIY